MSRNYIASELPLLLEVEPSAGWVWKAEDRQASPAGLSELAAFLHPDDRVHVLQTLYEAEARRQPRFQISARLSRASGQMLTVSIFGAAIALPDAAQSRYLCVITDISAHTSAIERFNLATSATREVIFLLDFDRNEHWWSQAFTLTFGHAPLLQEDVLERWFDLVHPADQPRIKLSHDAARAGTDEGWVDEYRMRRGDGSYVTVLDRARFFRRPDGTVARSISTLTDVSELRRVELMFSQTAAAAQDVIYSHDIEAGILWLNDALKNRYGHDPSLVSRHPAAWVDMIAPADRPGYLHLREQALQGDATRYEIRYRLQGAAGGLYSVIDRAQITRDEARRPIRIVGSIVDVTALHEEEERLHAVVEVAANAVYEYDVAAGTFRYSDGMARTFGHDWSDPQPALSKWDPVVHPEDRDRARDDFLQFVAGSERYARLEYRFARADGSYARVRERMIALRDEAGQALQVIGGIEDVTQEYDAQDRLRQSQKLEAIGKLTGGVAHDFNNLLTVILGSADLLENDATLGSAQRDLAHNVAMAARRGADLTGGLLAFARQQPLTPRPLDIAAVFAEMDSLLRRTLPAGITLDTVMTPELWLVEADPTHLNAALLNLCVNAADAMPEGGRITIESRPWVIDDSYRMTDPEARPGEFLRIDVTDTGHGMSSDVLARAFDPFFTTKPLGKGSGLGLSMVWGFAKQSGGHARIYSELNIGTTVSLFLPRSKSQLAAPPPVAAATVALGQGQHVLVVEDDPQLRRFVAAMVERLGYRASSAETGEAALALLRTRPEIQLLFTDVVMPGTLSGRELAEQALREFPGLRVLFSSGYSENAIIHNGRLDEGVQFLAKPYQLRDLAEKLQEVFRLPPRHEGSPWGLTQSPGGHSGAGA